MMRMRPGWYTVVMCFLSASLTSAAAVAIAIHANNESDHKWCDVVVTIDDANKQTPPATKSGRNFASEISRLRQRLDCP